MYRTFFSLLIACFVYSAHGQIIIPTKWTWKAEPISKGIYKLIFAAKIDSGWSVPSSYMTLEENGPIPLSIMFDTQYVKPVTKLGEKGKRVNSFNNVFGINLQLLQDTIICEQIVSVEKDTRLRGTITYMAFDDYRAVPPEEIPFQFDLKGLNRQGVYIEWDSTSVPK